MGDEINSGPKKIVSERGESTPLTDYEMKIDPSPEVEEVDAEIVYEDAPPTPPTEGDDERTVCLYCENPRHDLPRVDRFGLTCPGENAQAKAVQKYLMMREFCEDQEKIDNLDVDKLAEDAKAAYAGRKRSDVTQAELQADINMRLGRLRPKMKLRENLTSDGPDFEIPHITVPGRVPAPRGGVGGGPSRRPTKILTQKQQAEEARKKTAKLVVPDSLPNTVQVNEPDRVPPNQREREYDQMMFINKTSRGD